MQKPLTFDNCVPGSCGKMQRVRIPISCMLPCVLNVDLDGCLLLVFLQICKLCMSEAKLTCLRLLGLWSLNFGLFGTEVAARRGQASAPLLHQFFQCDCAKVMIWCKQSFWACGIWRSCGAAVCSMCARMTRNWRTKLWGPANAVRPGAPFALQQLLVLGNPWPDILLRVLCDCVRSSLSGFETLLVARFLAGVLYAVWCCLQP